MSYELNFETYIEVLLKNPLFSKICGEDEVLGILSCSGARIVRYEKGREIICEGAEVNEIGIILSGGARAEKIDIAGRRFILAVLAEGSIFGNVLSLGVGQKSPLTVTATTTSVAVHIPVSYVFDCCEKACARHNRLLRNMLNIISQKYFDLHDRLNCVIKPTLREKVMYYINDAVKRQGSRIVTIPFDREGLADYLNADRCALSRELSAMKRDGLIDYHKNTFKIL